MSDEWIPQGPFADDPPDGDLANRTAIQKMIAYVIANLPGYNPNPGVDWIPMPYAAAGQWLLLYKRRR
jgi:hypothetical protein